MTTRVILGDCRVALADLPDASVQCVVTSPPYLGLRDYSTAQWTGGNNSSCEHARSVWDGPKQTQGAQSGHAAKKDRIGRRECIHCGAVRVDNQIGLEASPDAYVAELVAVFRDVKRVLRDDGTLWLNLGDSYANDGKWGGSSGGKNAPSNTGAEGNLARRRTGLKPKDLMMIPARVAIALQDDGWYLRSDIIWAKPDPMPESVTDRPTSSHEHVFLLTKAARYFYDAAAIAEPAVSFSRQHTSGTQSAKTRALQDSGQRNARTVWSIATKPFSEAHFAAFPPELAERCIKAGTSERGACSACGASWVREVEKARTFESGSGRAGNLPAGKNGFALQGGGETLDVRRGPVLHNLTTGWRPTCACNAPTRPCVVLDCFGGAGTTGLVADRLGRDAVLIELNPEYAAMSRDRVVRDAGLFAEVSAT